MDRVSPCNNKAILRKHQCNNIQSSQHALSVIAHSYHTGEWWDEIWHAVTSCSDPNHEEEPNPPKHSNYPIRAKSGPVHVSSKETPKYQNGQIQPINSRYPILAKPAAPVRVYSQTHQPNPPVSLKKEAQPKFLNRSTSASPIRDASPSISHWDTHVFENNGRMRGHERFSSPPLHASENNWRMSQYNRYASPPPSSNPQSQSHLHNQGNP